MKTRLQQFLVAENISQAQFADSIHVARASISHIIAGRNKPGYDFILNTMKRFPELNIEWLLMGKGKMYRNATGESAGNSPLYDTETFPQETSAGQNREIDLFSPEEDIPIPEQKIEENIGNIIDIDTLDNTLQQTIKQRKASKIIIFFDDGTFQEFL